MRNNNNSSDSRRYFDWISHAKLDYISAQNLLKDERCYLCVAFHCQQCIEKALKAYILYTKHILVDGHNLTWLCKQAMKQSDHFEKYLKDSVKLNKYYIETRYPADKPMNIDYQTITKLFEITTEMFDFIGEEMKFNFR